MKKSIETSVLCWLATVSADGQPNVSPKEIFAHFGDTLLIANIASPKSVRNIRQHEQVCVSFIDIFTQKGYQVHGRAWIREVASPEYADQCARLLELTGGAFPFATFTEVEPTRVSPLLAPRYVLYPETTEADQVASAKRAYGCVGGESS